MYGDIYLTQGERFHTQSSLIPVSSIILPFGPKEVVSNGRSEIVGSKHWSPLVKGPSVNYSGAFSQITAEGESCDN